MLPLENLERQHSKCYCPLILVEKSAMANASVEEEMLSELVVYNVQPEENGLSYTTVRSTRGASKAVGFGAGSIKMPQALMQQMLG